MDEITCFRFEVECVSERESCTSHLTTKSPTSICSLDDPIVARLLREAPLASELQHSNRRFIEHLVGTWWILTKWNMPQSICRAGLLHSCYSTVFYPHALFNIRDRSKVRSIIGREAEALAYRLCVIDRPDLWSLVTRMPSLRGGLTVRRIDDGRRVFLPEGVVRSLLIIESANLAEQSAASDGSPTLWMSRLVSWSRLLGRSRLPLPFHLRPMLTAVAERKALEKYREAMKATRDAVPVFLDDTIRLNPWAGEPRLLRALCALERRDTERALSEALQGHTLLSGWSVAWDKRWALGTWLNLGAIIVQRVIRQDRSGADLSFKSVKRALTRAADARH